MRDTPTERRRGRPRLAERKSSVSTWIYEDTHDRLIALAKRNGLSVSEVIKRIVTRQLGETE